LFATLTFKRRLNWAFAVASAAAIAVAAGLWSDVATHPVQAGTNPHCGAVAEMLDKGLEAYKNGRYEIAVPALECVLRTDNGLPKFYAEFYSARVFSDDTSGFVDHTRAYALFQGISDEHGSVVDPDDVRRAPYVAKAITSLAGYVRRGLPEIGLKPDLERAVEFYRHSATFFNERDAQFELAKLHLAGTGVPLDVRLGLHYIQKLVQDSHAGAQAYMAEMYWKGTHVPVDHVRALALTKLAIDNASPSDRLWIEDSYQNFYCSTVAAERSRAAELSGRFRTTFARGPNTDRAGGTALPPAWGLGGRRELGLARTCSNGERIDMELRGAITPGTSSASTLSQQAPQQTQPAGMKAPAR
jgi:uncharacterized protein